MRAIFLCALLLVISIPPAARAQTVVDQTRRIIDGRPILDSDIRIARELKLVTPTAANDDAILVELENRMLMLNFISRVQSLGEPTPDEIASRRQRWEQAFDADVKKRLADVHFSDAELMAWFRDDLRIEKYEQQRFGREPDPQKATQEWIQGLRKRAGLK